MADEKRQRADGSTGFLWHRAFPERWIPIVWGAAWGLNVMGHRQGATPIEGTILAVLSFALLLYGIATAVSSIGRNAQALERISYARKSETERAEAARGLRVLADDLVLRAYAVCTDATEEGRRVKGLHDLIWEIGRRLEALMGTSQTQTRFWIPLKNEDGNGYWDKTRGIRYAENVLNLLDRIANEIRDGSIAIESSD